jgi:hypothetical protein
LTAEWLSELVLIEDEDREDIFAFMEFGADARASPGMRAGRKERRRGSDV